MCKHFHLEELSFPAERDLTASKPSCWFSRGSSNCRPSRKYWRSGVQRSTVACSRDTDRGRLALFSRVTGISREMWVPGSRERRAASSSPPADRFKAVANSRNSSPSALLPRTKNGIEIGSRSQSRRSATDAVRRTSISYDVEWYAPERPNFTLLE